MAPGGGFGALDTMNKTLKNNRGLLKKINVFEKVKNYSSALKKVKLDIPSGEVSSEKLEEIRIRTLREDRKQTIKQILKITFVILAIGVLLALVISGPINKY